MSTIIKRSFVGGELAPAVQSRVDTIKYEFGLKTCRNALVMRHGGVQNRPGTKLVGEIFVDGFPLTYGPAIRMIPFTVDQSNSYVLEFRTRQAPFFPTGACMRVIKNGAYVSTSILNILAVSKSNPAIVTTSAPHGIVTGQEIFITNCIGMEELNFRDLRVVVTGLSTFTLQKMDGTPFDSTNFSTYLFNGQAACIYETLATGILLTSLNEGNLKFVQNANSMIVVGAYDGVNPYFQQPIEIKRISDTNWTFTLMTFAPIQAPATALVATANAGVGGIVFRYRVAAINSVTGEESLPTAIAATAPCALPNATAPAFSNKLDWVAALGAVEYNVYKETSPGTGFYGLIGIANGVHFEDIGVSSSSKEPVKSNNPFASVAPTCVAFFQQRLLFGNSTSFPERIWGSRIGLQNNFGVSRQLQDDDSIQFDMTANQINKIQNMMKSVNTKQHTCSLASTSSLPQGSFWVGFFVILQVIESIWNRIFERGKLIEYTDVKAYFLIKKGKIAQFPEAGGYLFNPGVIPKVYSDGTAVLQQQSFASVFEYLMWRLHTHANLKLLGLWIFPYFINYFILAISWPAILRGAIAFDSFYFASYVVLVYLVEIIVSYWIGTYYIKTPKRLVYSLLFPLYWALFPWVLIYARLTVPQKRWD